MPLDNSMDRAWQNKCIGWQLKFSFIPRRCYFSKKVIWLRHAYRGAAMWTQPGENIFDIRWADRHEYLIARIKGVI